MISVAGGARRGPALAFLLAGLGAAPAAAAPADLAGDFGEDGIATVETPGRGSDASAQMAIGPDEEVFVLFSAYSCTWPWECPMRLTLARFDAAGKRDRTFNVELTIDGSGEKKSFGVAIGPDGKPVVATYDRSGGGEDGLRIFRFDRAGRADPGFNGGLVAVDLPNQTRPADILLGGPGQNQIRQ